MRATERQKVGQNVLGILQEESVLCLLLTGCVVQTLQHLLPSCPISYAVLPRMSPKHIISARIPAWPGHCHLCCESVVSCPGRRRPGSFASVQAGKPKGRSPDLAGHQADCQPIDFERAKHSADKLGKRRCARMSLSLECIGPCPGGSLECG